MNIEQRHIVDLSNANPVHHEIHARKKYVSKKYFTILTSVILVMSLALGVHLTSGNQTQSISKAAMLQTSLIHTPTSQPAPIAKKEVIGFLPSWNVAATPTIQTKTLTQLIYFGLSITETGDLVKYNENNQMVTEWERFLSNDFSRIRKTAEENGTKILISIKSFDNTTTDTVMSNKTATEKLITQIKKLIQEYDLDGINFDFEYFTDSDFPTVKYQNSFLETVTTSLKKDNPNLIISIDVNATVVLNDRAYDMVKIGSLVDQVIIMGYDYTRPSSTIAGPVAPLYGKDNQHNIHESVTSLHGRVPAEKIIVALPFYGYEWQTVNRKFNSPTINNSGAIATYKRVAALIEQRDDIVVHLDETSQTPWLVYEQSGAIKQIYYDDSESFSAKLDYVKQQNLGGIGIWALGYEGENTALWEEITKQR